MCRRAALVAFVLAWLGIHVACPRLCLQATFAKYDKDANGRLDIYEVKQLLRQLNDGALQALQWLPSSALRRAVH